MEAVPDKEWKKTKNISQFLTKLIRIIMTEITLEGCDAGDPMQDAAKLS